MDEGGVNALSRLEGETVGVLLIGVCEFLVMVAAMTMWVAILCLAGLAVGTCSIRLLPLRLGLPADKSEKTEYPPEDRNRQHQGKEGNGLEHNFSGFFLLCSHRLHQMGRIWRKPSGKSRIALNLELRDSHGEEI